LGGTNYVEIYNKLGPTNTFDGFNKDTGELQVTTENEQGTAWSYWNYIPRWNGVNPSYLIANPLATGYSDHNMSPNIGTTTYNLYSILGYADDISSGKYRLDGFRLITNAVETSWQYGVDNDYNVIARWVYKENNWQVADYIAGEGVTIKNGIISANGSEIVQVNPIVTSGTQLAIINGKSIYAPTTTVTQTLTEGTEIGEVNGTKLYAPSGGSDVTVTTKTTTGTNIADIAVNGTTYQLFAPSGGGGGGGSGSGYTETSLWSGYKADTGTINLNDSVENYDIVLIKVTSHPEQPSNSYYESYFTILTKDIIYNQHWQYNILVVRGHTEYGNGSMDCYFSSSTSFVIESINISDKYKQVKPAVLEVIGLKFGGSSGHNNSTEEQVVGTWIDGSTLYEKTIEYTSSIGTGWTTLYQDTSISIKDYKASIIIDNDGSAVLNVYQRASNNYFTTTTLANGNGLRIYNSGDTRLGGTITIQYTKTS
jgi:hypothetical protein